MVQRKHSSKAAVASPNGEGRRERRKVETQQRILRAAVQLFTRHGFTDTTVEQITEAADIGKGTFFNYYKSKEHVLFALLASIAQQFTDMGNKLADAPHVREAMKEYVRHALTHPERSQVMVRNLFGSVMVNDRLREPFADVARAARAALTRIMARGQQTGEIRRDMPPEKLAAMFQGFIFGTQILWSLEEPSDLFERVDRMLEVFWDGIAPRPVKQVRK